MRTKITTTGQLRTFLSDMIVAIKDGTLEPERAQKITKMAAQINESFYSEIKIAVVTRDVGRSVAELGNLDLGDTASLDRAA